jgi:glycine/D-amino acid oxidase-like deaminating enzyme
VNRLEREAYGSSWYAATMVPAAARGQLTIDLDVDVCVVGGGLAGLTTARELARRGWSVALLEARRLAWNASGRNDGFVLPGFAESIDKVVSRVGLDHAKALWALSETGLRYVRSTIADERLPGVAPVAGWLKASKVDNEDEMLADEEFYRRHLGAEVEVWSTAQVRDMLRSQHYFNALHFPRAFHIHPLNYALGLADLAEAAGVRIFEDTPARAIDPAGVRKRVTTPAGRVRASQIVLACNVHLGSLLPRITGTLMPIWSYVIVTKPLGSRLDEALTYRGAVTDTDLANNHYRIVDGDRLLWGGRSRTWDAEARGFAPSLVADIAEVYPQLGQVEADYVWSGVLGNALHRMPQIGELSPGLWLASGFGGHGLNTTAMAGNILAQAIAEGDDTWRLFAPYELVWAGGKVGRAVMQVYYSWFSARERWAARQAREREDELRRARKRAAQRAGEELPRIEAKIGAVVPSEQLPQEPSLAQLPVDPLIAGEEVHSLQPIEGNPPGRLDGREPARESHPGGWRPD